MIEYLAGISARRAIVDVLDLLKEPLRSQSDTAYDQPGFGVAARVVRADVYVLGNPTTTAASAAQ